MKQFLSILFFSLILFSAKAQYPVQQQVVAPNTIGNVNGAIRGNIVVSSFGDTTIANSSKASFYDGFLIRTGDSLWVRSNGGWVLVNGGGSGADSLTYYTVFRADSSRKNIYTEINNLNNKTLYFRSPFVVQGDTVSLKEFNYADSGYATPSWYYYTVAKLDSVRIYNDSLYEFRGLGDSTFVGVVGGGAGGNTIYTGDGTITDRQADIVRLLRFWQPDKQFGIEINENTATSGDTLSVTIGTKTGFSGTHITVDDLNAHITYHADRNHEFTNDDSTARVGINTAAPEASLHVVGGVITDSIRIGNDWFFTKKITLSPIDINSGNTTPVLAIPAPGENRAIDIISGSARLAFNSASYDNPSALNLSTFDNGDGKIGAFNYLALTGAANASCKLFMSDIELNFIENTPVYLRFDSDNSSGDSDIYVYLYYRIINL